MPKLINILKQIKKYPLNEYSDKVVKFLIDKWQKEDPKATESIITQLIHAFEKIKDGLPSKSKQVAIPERFKDNKQQYLDIVQYTFDEMVTLLKSLPKDEKKLAKDMIKYFMDKEHLDKPLVQSYVNRFIDNKRELKYKVENGDEDRGFSAKEVQKMIPPEIFRNDLYLDISNWRQWIKLEQMMDALFPRTISISTEEDPTNNASTEADKIYEKDGIEVYRGDAQHKCVSYNPTENNRKKYSWCIAQPGNSNYDHYRFMNGTNRMFYFVFDRTRKESDNFHAFVVHVGEGNKQYWVTDARNGGDHPEKTWQGVCSYLPKDLGSKLKGLEPLFKYIPPSKAEVSAAALRGRELTKQDFRELDDDTKVQYIQSNVNKEFLKKNGILDILSNTLKNIAINYGQDFSWNELKNNESLAKRYAVFRFRHTNYGANPIGLPFVKYLDEPAKKKYYDTFKKKYLDFPLIEKYFGPTITKEYVEEEVKELGYLPLEAGKYIQDPNLKKIFDIYVKLFKNWVVNPIGSTEEDASTNKDMAMSIRPILLTQHEWQKLSPIDQDAIVALTKKYSYISQDPNGRYQGLLYGAPFMIDGGSKGDLLVLPTNDEGNEWVIADKKGKSVIPGTHNNIKIGDEDAENPYVYQKYYPMKDVKIDGKPLVLKESKYDDWDKYKMKTRAGIIK